MNRKIKIIANGFLAVSVTVLLAACASRPQPMGPGGTAWGAGAFSSNGERIYFTATSERGTAITLHGRTCIKRSDDGEWANGMRLMSRSWRTGRHTQHGYDADDDC